MNEHAAVTASRRALHHTSASALAGSTSTGAIQAGITVDVHQDVLDPQAWPNDFHIECLVCPRSGFPPGTPPSFDQLFAAGQQQCWPWVLAVDANGRDISRTNALYVGPSNCLDVFLKVAVPGRMGAAEPFSIQPGGFLIARQTVQFLNNNHEPEERSFWEIHGARAPQACCFRGEYAGDDAGGSRGDRRELQR